MPGGETAPYRTAYGPGCERMDVSVCDGARKSVSTEGVETRDEQTDIKATTLTALKSKKCLLW